MIKKDYKVWLTVSRMQIKSLKAIVTQVMLLVFLESFSEVTIHGPHKWNQSHY